MVVNERLLSSIRFSEQNRSESEEGRKEGGGAEREISNVNDALKCNQPVQHSI